MYSRRWKWQNLFSSFDHFAFVGLAEDLIKNSIPFENTIHRKNQICIALPYVSDVLYLIKKAHIHTFPDTI